MKRLYKSIRKHVLRALGIFTLFSIVLITFFPLNTQADVNGDNSDVKYRITSDYEMIIGDESDFTYLNINGTVPWREYRDKITKISFCGSVVLYDTYGVNYGQAFSGTSLKEIDFTNANTDFVIQMDGMFRGCKSLTSVYGLVTSKANTLTEMFYGCSSLKNIDLSGFDSSNVVYMDYMFYGCTSLTSIDLSGFDTSKVTKMDNMFKGCTNLTDIALGSKSLFNSSTGIPNNNWTRFKLIDGTKVDGPAITSIADYSGTNPGWYTTRNCPNGHTFTNWTVTKEATCISTGSKTAACSKCGVTTTETIPITDHTWSKDYTVDIEATCAKEGSESIHCLICDTTKAGSSRTIAKKAHNYGEWITSNEATCTENGIKEKECSVCGDRVTETIPPNGHIYSEEYTIDKEPTCAEDGSKSRHCANCDEVTDIVVLPRTDHGTCGANGDNISWRYSDDGTLSFTGSGEMTDYETSGSKHSPWGGVGAIKKVVFEDGITKIGDWAFYKSSGIQQVQIPGSVIKVGTGAFDGCTSLKAIDLPNSVQSIGDGAFENSGIESFTVPPKVTKVSDCLFYGGSIKTISLHSGVTSIGKLAFYRSSLQSIDIPDTVSVIAGDAFCWSAIESITLPNTLNAIENSMFLKCYRLKSITIPDSVTRINYGAFWECSSLESIIIPDSVTYIGNSAFNRCSSLKTITIPKGVTAIPYGAFSECTNLESIIIPDSVTRIDEIAFYECKNLKSLTIPESVTAIDDNCLYNCSSLDSIYVVKDSYADKWVGNSSKKVYVYKSGEHYMYKTITKDATCAEEGELIETCSICGETAVVKVPSLSHEGEWEIVTESTCTEDGLKKRVCSLCGVEQTKVIKAGHKWNDEYTIDKKATLAGKGSKSIHCSVCDEIDPESVVSIPKLTVKATSISKVTPAKKGFTVKWKKGSGITGYEIQYALNSKFTKSKKTVKITKATTVSKKITKLKAKKKYYVRVRAYKTYKGTKYYSKWSKASKVTTKK